MTKRRNDTPIRRTAKYTDGLAGFRRAMDKEFSEQ
jgi:hypothetical protein